MEVVILLLQEKELWEVIGPENTHKCREPPFEAAIYSLKAEGEKRGKFRANSKAELTVEIDKFSEQRENKQERSSLELPVDFSQEDVAKVSYNPDNFILKNSYYSLKQ